ncbi:MAG: cation-translocating P-type ATPase [Lewinellaceae bacterium]|nr:cation-translocating P-type ATPase [Lewinellaceae bacterium]
MPTNILQTEGLSEEQVIASRALHGSNTLEFKKPNWFLTALLDLAKEPMVLLLLAASLIYFVSGEAGDGIFLAGAILLVATISLYQDSRSKNALENLNKLSQPKCKVVRSGAVQEINIEEVVVGDTMIVEEGGSIPADGRIIHSNDFSVNESMLTGESLPVFKNQDRTDNQIFRGTTVTSGLAAAEVMAIGHETSLGKIGKSLEDIQEEPTPLEIQIGSFVRYMVLAGAAIFFIVWGINYVNSGNVLDSLLKALTLAMSILPEEIPVAFTTFMALGSWKLMKMGIVVKQMKTVETLGSATLICTDKTGTLTENKMSLAKTFVFKKPETEEEIKQRENQLIRIAMFASEPIPFDPMEKAIHTAYRDSGEKDERQEYKMTYEYPLEGKPPMMTHIFENESGGRVIATKGAPEALVAVSQLTEEEKNDIHSELQVLAKDGYRVLAVGEAEFSGIDFPAEQTEFQFTFLGMLAFYDPPKANISEVLQAFDEAGIEVKIITGDNEVTTKAIAKQVGFRGAEKSISGDAIMHLTDEELKPIVAETGIFTRMFPEAKLRIINALKANKEIVAMTGDGINDGPALKSAHIGIAMGEKGTEIAKQAASLILLEDDLSKMVDAVAMGRKIYSNLKKAIQYIISIHLPIILVIFLPLALGWIYPNIFSPIHIIFMELIMGPTCSIIYENEPMEKDTMLQKPRAFTTTFFNWKELSTSIVQGLVITAGALFVYQYSVNHGGSEAITRTMVFVAMITANIMLTLVNRSFHYSIFTTLRYKNHLVPLIILITISLTALMVYFQPMTRFFEFASLSTRQIGVSMLVGAISVIWFELVKWYERKAVSRF